MRPAPFHFTRAESLGHALEALANVGTVLAGGQALLTILKLRQATVRHLVDINGLPELSGVAADNGEIVIGGLTRVADIAASPLLREEVPSLTEAAKKLADPQVRARATVAGNLCFADPRANLVPVLMTLDAEVTIASLKGERAIPVERVPVAFRTTCLAPGELVTYLRFKRPAAHARGYYHEVARQPNGQPIVNVSVHLTGDPVEHARVAAGGVAPTTVRLRRVEESLVGRPLDEQAIASAADRINEEQLDPLSDMHAPPDYRLSTAKVLIGRSLKSMAEGRSR